VLLRNRPAHVAAVLQIIASRRCVVSLNPFQHANKIAQDLVGLKLPVLIADACDWEVEEIRESARQAGSLGIALLSEGELSASLQPGFDVAPDPATHAGALSDICILMLTSGTTGPAKRIKLPYANFARALFDAAHYESRKGGELQLKEAATLLSTPLVHIGGMYAAILSMMTGRPLVIQEKFNVEQWSRAVARHRPKSAMLPPTAVRMILDAKVPAEMLSSLLAIRTGSSPLDPAMAEAFENTYGVPLLDTYGATEFAGAVAGWTLRDYKQYGKDKRGSVGRAQPGCELRVIDPETFEPMPAGTVGLLEVRSAQIDGDSWVRTTDLAELDVDGFLYIRGRADDAIIRGGFKVLPREVEKAFCEHPSVADVCVVGVPDERLGAVPVAVVELKGGAEGVTVDELMGFVRERLVSYQVPVSIRVVPSLPRTPSMKISRHEVKALLAI
jgi:acyl-coenzyme A synthetase/AMP-(fatty) acid ligase